MRMSLAAERPILITAPDNTKESPGLGPCCTNKRACTSLIACCLSYQIQQIKVFDTNGANYTKIQFLIRAVRARTQIH